MLGVEKIIQRKNGASVKIIFRTLVFFQMGSHARDYAQRDICLGDTAIYHRQRRQGALHANNQTLTEKLNVAEQQLRDQEVAHVELMEELRKCAI